MKEKWYTIDKKNIFKILNTREEGLTTKEVNIRLKQYGKMYFQKQNKKHLYKYSLNNLKTL